MPNLLGDAIFLLFPFRYYDVLISRLHFVILADFHNKM